MTRAAPPALVTVILPCHDVAAHVGAAIGSLRAQSFTDFEALVIDDGSRDGTSEAAQAAIGTDARFRLITTAQRGLSAARNLGLDAARGSLVAFLDGDDRYAPEFLAAHLAALEQSGADWTASAISLLAPDGTLTPHPAIHGATHGHGDAHWISLEDARVVAKLFPSAWNKLYRRDLIGDLRFRDGALYEDHPFFWALATRAGRIRYLPRALYHYRQGRAGQITERGDRQILQQITRLEEVAQILRKSGLSHQTEGLSLLTTRLVHERLQPVTSHALRAAFLDAASGFLRAQGLGWARGGARDIPAGLAPALDPEMRLTVIVRGTQGPAMQRTREALTAQRLPVTILPAPSEGAFFATALRVETPWLAILRAGDCPTPDWAEASLETLRAASPAPCIGLVRVGPDDGLARAGCPAPDMAALILRRDLLEALPADARAWARMPEAAAACCLVHSLQALGARVIGLSEGVIEIAAPAPLPLRATARALRGWPDLSGDAASACFAHRVQIQMTRLPHRRARLRLALQAALIRRTAGLPPPPRDVALGPYLRVLMGRG